MSDSTQILRQWMLLRILSARRQGVTLKALAEELKASSKTIQRDLALLQQLAFPIEQEIAAHGRKLWKMTDANEIPALTFTLEEAAAIYWGSQFLEGLAGTYFWQGSRTALKKIRTALGTPALRHLQKLAMSIHLTQAKVVDYESRAQLIDDLMVAIDERKLTVITYQSLRATEPVTLLDIYPYALIHHKHALYIIAWSRDHESIRTFKVDRITHVELHNWRFNRPEDFDPAAHLEHSFGIFSSEEPPQQVKVRFAPGVSRILEEKKFHPSQQLTPQPGGSTLAEYTLGPLEEFISWLLSFGPQVEVLEPPHLRQRLLDSLNKTLALYRKPTPANPTKQTHPPPSKPRAK